MKKYYLGEPFNIHIKLLIDITQKKNCVIATKKVKAKLPLFHVNGSWIIPIYANH